jgi:hypothetical protein
MTGVKQKKGALLKTITKSIYEAEIGDTVEGR